MEERPPPTNQQSIISNQQSTNPLLRLGLRLVVGLPRAAAEAIEQARRVGPFSSIADFTRRTGLSQAAIERLADADALASLAADRRLARWQALAQKQNDQPLPLFDTLPDEDEPPLTLPAMNELEQVFADYRTSGLSLRGHPLQFYRAELERMKITPAGLLKNVPNGRWVRTAGIVLLRQRPSTAKGITFVTLEDETGAANLVIHQKTWERFSRITRHSAAWIAHGQLESKHSVIHLVVRRLEDLSSTLAGLRTKSRDFQ